MNRRPSQRLLFASACLLFAGAGTWLGSHGKGHDGIADEEKAGRSTLQSAAAASSAKAGANPPLRRILLLRKMLAKEDTQSLWTWLRGDAAMDEKIRSAIAAELVDRLGWGAWDAALSSGDDPKVRMHVTEIILEQLSWRDPWQAYEVWKQHREEFGPEWATYVVFPAQSAAAEGSATLMTDIFRESAKADSNQGCFLKYGPNFDFAGVMDYLAAAELPPLNMPYNMLPAWGDRAPQDAAQWLSTHPEFIKNGEQVGAAQQLLWQIARIPLDAPGREEALAALKQLPRNFIADSWRTISYQQDGKFSAPALDAATAMDQREAYLVPALRQTMGSDVLDPSWQQIPPSERAELLNEVVGTMGSAEKLSPVDLRKRQHWLEMVNTAWGLPSQP